MKYSPDWDLATIPDAEFYSEAGRRRARTSGGVRPGAGRKPELTQCPKCGAAISKTDLRRSHKC